MKKYKFEIEVDEINPDLSGPDIGFKVVVTEAENEEEALSKIKKLYDFGRNPRITEIN